MWNTTVLGRWSTACALATDGLEVASAVVLRPDEAALLAGPAFFDGFEAGLASPTDFPTGGQILGRRGIRETYSTGRGSVTMRGVASIETIEAKGRPDRDAVIITATSEVLTAVRRAKSDAQVSMRAEVATITVVAPTAVEAAVRAGEADLLAAANAASIDYRRGEFDVEVQLAVL